MTILFLLSFLIPLRLFAALPVRAKLVVVLGLLAAGFASSLSEIRGAPRKAAGELLAHHPSGSSGRPTPRRAFAAQPAHPRQEEQSWLR
jgi:hypothetical protein